MIDLGISKLALIGAVALIVIGPEKLPRVARTVGALLGKAQRYVADVKAEVNRSMDLEELKKMKESKKNWRIKQKAMPQWFKARVGIRTRTQSGAARVARFRPRPNSPKR
jgi:sec-independent protein translocase protein TatB